MSMSMSIRQKELTKKVLCSLLAAGVINVCISGGDVWAAEGYKNETIDYYNGGKLGITELTTGEVTIGGVDYTEVTITAQNPDSKNASATGVYVNPAANAEVLGEKISITALNEYTAQSSRAVEFGGADKNTATKLVLGSAGTTKSIDLVSHSQGEAMGIFVAGGSLSQGVDAQVNGELLNIDVSGDYNGNQVSGLHVQNNTADITRPENGASLEVNAAKTVIKSNGSGLSAYSNGTLKVNGDLEVDAVNAVSARGYSQIVINEDGQHMVKLNGNIAFDYDKATSDTPMQADVTINLSNADSYLNGNIVKIGELQDTDPKKEVTGMTLGIADGATWNTDADSFVNTLNLNDGVINVNGGAGQEVKIGAVQGEGGTVNLKTASDLSTADLTIGMTGTEDKTAAKLAVNYTGITADDLEGKADALNTLASHVSVSGNEGLKATANVAEGLLKGAVSAELEQEPGSGNNLTINTATLQQSEESSTMASMRNIASVAIVSWRQEDSTLSQRLGELRSSEGDQGIWTRMSRGEFEYSGAYKNQYNFFQLGYDKAFGSWHYGAALSHNDGKTTYDNGKGENKSTSLSLYGTWLGAKGHYADIVLKQGRLSNEFDNYAAAGHTHGDYNAWGTSLSGEYGMKVGLDNGWYVTPQAQLTLMRIGGEDYTTDNGINVSQDTLQSCVGRVGFEAGKTIGDKGSIYAKASLLHEFAGTADTYLSLNGVHNSYSQDIGGTWYEAGLGFNYKTTANSYLYADVVKTFGDDLKTPWQWNVGARWTF